MHEPVKRRKQREVSEVGELAKEAPHHHHLADLTLCIIIMLHKGIFCRREDHRKLTPDTNNTTSFATKKEVSWLIAKVLTVPSSSSSSSHHLFHSYIDIIV